RMETTGLAFGKSKESHAATGGRTARPGASGASIPRGTRRGWKDVASNTKAMARFARPKEGNDTGSAGRRTGHFAVAPRGGPDQSRGCLPGSRRVQPKGRPS